MSITTYAELQTAAANWMDRSDYSARVPEFIAMAEAFFNRQLRVREMLTTSTFNTSGGSASLPSDFAGIQAVIWTGNPVVNLEPWDNQPFQMQYGNLVAGTPSAYMIQGSTIYVAPVDNTTSLKLVYFQKIPALSTNSTNWLLTAHPDLYLFATLAEYELFTGDGQSGSVWKQRRDGVLDEIIKNDAFWRGPSPTVRILGPTP